MRRHSAGTYISSTHQQKTCSPTFTTRKWR